MLIWYNLEIKNAISDRNLANRIWRRRKSVENWEIFRAKRNFVTHMIRAAKNSFLENYCGPDLPAKIFWNHIKNLGVGKSKKSFQSVPFTAQELNNYFCNIIRPHAIEEYKIPIGADNCNAFKFSLVTEEEVRQSLYDIKSNAVGLDKINLRFLKIILPYFLEPITHLFNFLISNSVYPKLWKIALVTPISKIKTPTEIKDFRPISLLPCLSKAFEILVKIQIMEHLNTENLLSKFQSGFRSNHSTTTAMLHICDDLRRSIDIKEGTFLVLLDFSSAFISVDHNILLNKLFQLYNFSFSALKLVKFYLCDRSQAVFSNNETSDFLNLSLGVPQGSVLGPLFFLLFINDIIEFIINSKSHLYADDLQIYITSKFQNIGLSIDLLNEDLQRIIEWCEKNRLYLNPKKSQAIFINNKSIDTSSFPPIKIGQVVIPFYEKVKDLGIIINKSLTWDDHISMVTQKIFFSLRSLWTVTRFANTNLRKKLFFAFLFPLFLYCDTVFYGMSKGCEHKLQLLFNACIRYVFNLRKFDHIHEFSDKILSCNLETYYKIRVLVQFYKIISTHSPSYLYEKLTFSNSSRNKNIIIPINHFNKFNLSFFVRGAMLWNQLPLSIRESESTKLFKTNAFEYFNNL